MPKVFAKPNDYTQQVGGTKPDGWVEMTAQRPGPDYVAQEDGTWLEKPKSYTVRKTVIWSRTTEQEAETLDTALKNAPVKQRRMWDDSQYLDSADDLFDTLHSQMADAFGATRADELLAPEDA